MTGIIDPRRQGVLDMQVWIGFCIAQGIEVIFYLDGNENLKDKVGKWCELPQYEKGKHVTSTEDDGSLATLVTILGLVDVFRKVKMRMMTTKRVFLIFPSQIHSNNSLVIST